MPGPGEIASRRISPLVGMSLVLLGVAAVALVVALAFPGELFPVLATAVGATLLAVPTVWFVRSLGLSQPPSESLWDKMKVEPLSSEHEVVDVTSNADESEHIRDSLDTLKCQCGSRYSYVFHASRPDEADPEGLCLSINGM